MKKTVLIFALAVLLISCAASYKGEGDKEKMQLVTLKITNVHLDHGNLYLDDGFSSAFFVARVRPGQTTEVRIPAPFTNNRYRLFVSFDGRIRNEVILADTIEPGDRIEWDLFSNSVVWSSGDKRS